MTTTQLFHSIFLRPFQAEAATSEPVPLWDAIRMTLNTLITHITTDHPEAYDSKSEALHDLQDFLRELNRSVFVLCPIADCTYMFSLYAHNDENCPVCIHIIQGEVQR